MTEEEPFSDDQSSSESEEANEEPIAAKYDHTIALHVLLSARVCFAVLLWCKSLIKIRVGAPPTVATELGFTQNPIPYESLGQYTAKAGAKSQKPEVRV